MHFTLIWECDCQTTDFETENRFERDTNKQPIMSDEEYDQLCEYIKSKYPNNTIVDKGHTNTIVKNKVTLPFEMWSMNKLKQSKVVCFSYTLAL